MHQALMKATEKNPRHRLKIYVGLLIVIIAFGAAISFLNLQGFSQDIRSRADQSADDANCPKPPDCCVRMASSHDPFECDWPIRGYCTLDICNGIDGKKQRCGWYWIWHDKDASPNKDIGTNTPNGYGCMIGDSEATMHPKYSSSGATVTPIPLASPTPLPTAIPPTPTSGSNPTVTPVPTGPTVTPSPTVVVLTLTPTNIPLTTTPIPTATPTVTPWPQVSPRLPKTPPDPYPLPPYCI